MTKPPVDAERLAALLDGRLSEEERKRLLAQLASSADDVELLADAAAVLGEASLTSGHTQPVRRVRMPPLWRRWLPALAAASILIAALPLIWSRWKEQTTDDIGRFASAIDMRRSAGPPNDRPWPASRGTSDGLAISQRSVRLGVRIMDLEVALRARDSSAAGIAKEIATLLDAVPASAPVASAYRDLAVQLRDGRGNPTSAARDARAGAASVADRAFVELGALIEAERIAAVRGDTAFLRNPRMLEALDEQVRSTNTPDFVRQDFSAIRARLTRPKDIDLAALSAEITALLRALAG